MSEKNWEEILIEFFEESIVWGEDAESYEGCGEYVGDDLSLTTLSAIEKFANKKFMAPIEAEDKANQAKEEFLKGFWKGLKN